MDVPETLSLTVTDGVGRVVVDRPPVNALSSAEYVEYADFFETLAEDADLQVIVFETAGDVYLGGHDVNEFVDLDAGAAETLTARAQRFFRAVDELPVPTIAAVDGAAVGTGLAFTCVTDVRYASLDAAFGLPEVDRGVLGGYKFTQRHVSEGLARELFYTGETISAVEAHEAGLVQEYFHTDEDLRTGVDDLATTIADKDRATIRLAKQSVVETAEMETHPGYERECEYTVALREHDTANEASRAFFEE